MNIKILHNKYFKLKEVKNKYGSIFPKFALGKKTENKVEVISFFNSCRELFNFCIRRRVNNGFINTKILNLLVWFITPNQLSAKNKLSHDKFVYGALHALNVIEKELKWKKTTVKKLSHKLGNKHSLYLFIASPKWMFSPPLLSLYALIIRTGTLKNISKTKSIDELSVVYSNNKNRNTDATHLKEIVPVLKSFLTNIDKIYKGRNQKMNFNKSILTRSFSAYDEGIIKLIRGKTDDTHILNQFLKYAK